MEETHLSPQAHQRLAEELELRTGPRRREISEWIERAREHGDIRENADYDAAKTEQGHNEARVRQLEAILKSAVVVESASTESVVAGTVVEVRMEGDDETSRADVDGATRAIARHFVEEIRNVVRDDQIERIFHAMREELDDG